MFCCASIELPRLYDKLNISFMCHFKVCHHHISQNTITVDPAGTKLI